MCLEAETRESVERRAGVGGMIIDRGHGFKSEGRRSTTCCSQEGRRQGQGNESI